MKRIWDFGPCVEKLGQTNSKYDQSDAASECFDIWYKVAKEYASGEIEGDVEMMAECTLEALNIMLTTFTKDRINDPSSDEYVVRELFENAQKICDIFIKKPKFMKVLSSKAGQRVWNCIETNGMVSLEEIAFRESARSSLRVLALITLRDLIDMSTFYMHEYPKQIPESPISLSVKNLILIATRVGVDSMVRSEALNLTRSVYQQGSNTSVLHLLVKYAQDVATFELIWFMNLLDHEECVEKLCERVRTDCSDGNSSSSSSLSNILLESLYEAIVNSQMESRYVSSAVRMDEEYDRNVCHANQHRFYRESDQQILLARILRYCIKQGGEKDMNTKKKECKGMDMDYDETPDIYLQVMEALLKSSPDSAVFLDVILSVPSYRIIAMLVGICDIFKCEAWIDPILPFIRDRISHMSYNGVSGNQTEQEVINLLREACRLFYISQDLDHVPSQSLGYNLFISIVQAVRHGYIETERFTELLATVIRHHITPENVANFNVGNEVNKLTGSCGISWISSIFLPTICHNHKTYRAISECMMILLGLESSSFGTETSSAVRTNDANEIGAILCSLASLRTQPADQFWSELFTSFSKVVDPHTKATCILLESVQTELNFMIKCGGFRLERLNSLNDLVEAISLHTQSLFASRLFNIALMLIAMHPDGCKLSNDDVMVNILSFVIIDDENSALISDSGIREALGLCGDKARSMLAAIAPYLCLDDPSAVVRVSALHAMLDFPELFSKHQADILHAVSKLENSSAEDCSKQFGIDDYQIAVAACPLLAELSIAVPNTLGTCLSRLVELSSILAENHTMERPELAIEALNKIPERASRDQLVRFCLTDSGLRLLPILRKLSFRWRNLLRELEDEMMISKVSGKCVESGPNARLESVRYPGMSLDSLDTYERCAEVSEDGTVLSPASRKNLPLAVAIPVDCSAIYNSMMKDVEDDSWIDAMEKARSLKTISISYYESNNIEQFIAENVFMPISKTFPTSTGTNAEGAVCYSRKTLEDYDKHMNVFTKLQSILPDESEKFLQISSRIADLNTAKFHAILNEHGAEAACKWAKGSNLLSPQLKYKMEGLSEKKTESSIRRMFKQFAFPKRRCSNAHFEEEKGDEIECKREESQEMWGELERLKRRGTLSQLDMDAIQMRNHRCSLIELNSLNIEMGDVLDGKKTPVRAERKKDYV